MVLKLIKIFSKPFLEYYSSKYGVLFLYHSSGRDSASVESYSNGSEASALSGGTEQCCEPRLLSVFGVKI